MYCHQIAMFLWDFLFKSQTYAHVCNRSSSCVQKLGYDCKRSRLLNTPVGDSDNFSPYGYWVSRQNRMMDYWAGSLPGIFQQQQL